MIVDLIMNMYNLIEYSDICSNSTVSLDHFKTQEPLPNNADLTIENSSSFKYKSDLLGNSIAEGAKRVWKNAKIIVPLKCVGNFLDH